MTDHVQVADNITVSKALAERAAHEQRLGVKIDPDRFALALNREMRRRLAKAKTQQRVKPGEPVVAPPIIVRPPIPMREALDKTAAALAEEMARHTYEGTAVTLQQVLDRAEAEIVEKAWKNGHPIPREQIRHALEEIRLRAERAGRK